MNNIEYSAEESLINLEKDLKMEKLKLKSKRAYLTSLEKYDDEHTDILKYKKRTQLTIEEHKIRIRILQFEIQCLEDELKEIVKPE